MTDSIPCEKVHCKHNDLGWCKLLAGVEVNQEHQCYWRSKQ